MKPEDINWDEAPEGTDAAVIKHQAIAAYGQWRKFEGNDVYFYKNGLWHIRSNDIETWKRVNEYVERPLIVETELPDGKAWLEGYTHYSPLFGGLFFNELGYFMGHNRVWPSELAKRYYLDLPNTIKRFPGAKPKAREEAPIKKKPVGWWA